MLIGKIQLTASLENDGDSSQILFSENENAEEWTEVLISVCPINDSIPQNLFWKVNLSLNILNLTSF